MSAWPRPAFPSWLFEYDKLAHAGLYGVLGLTFGWARRYDATSPPHLLLIALGGIYGATDEWHQAFVVGRTPGWGDWIADMTGVSIGYFVALFFLLRASRRLMPTPETDVPD